MYVCFLHFQVGTVEGQYFRKTGKLVSLSPQNLVDCDKTCHGCGGGLMDRALKYIEQNGIYTEQDYPYHGKNEVCHANRSSALIKISSHGYIKSKDESDLQKAVADIGPVSVAIQVTYLFQLYKSGEQFVIKKKD